MDRVVNDVANITIVSNKANGKSTINPSNYLKELYGKTLNCLEATWYSPIVSYGI